MGRAWGATALTGLRVHAAIDPNSGGLCPRRWFGRFPGVLKPTTLSSMKATLMVLLLLVFAPTANAQPVAVTIDDLPWVGGLAPGDDRDLATDRILDALGTRHVPATGFVVCRRWGKRVDTLQRWLDAGMDLGNHSDTHPHLDDLSDEAWETNVRKCKDRLGSMRGKRRPSNRYFRYPYLQQGKSVVVRDRRALALKQMGYQNAHVTIDTGEWALVKPYVDAKNAGDEARAAQVAEAYVDHVVAATLYYRALAREQEGRDIRHVLLLHANALAADSLGPLLDALKRQGVTFIPLSKALQDPVYAKPDRYAGGIDGDGDVELPTWLANMAIGIFRVRRGPARVGRSTAFPETEGTTWSLPRVARSLFPCEPWSPGLGSRLLERCGPFRTGESLRVR